MQSIDEIYDDKAAAIFGISKNQITVMIHSGSRGFGYQICDEYSKGMGRALEKYGISVPDRQLACAPVKSPEGQAYISAMKCAANYAWNNRQCLMHLVRMAFEKFFSRSFGEGIFNVFYLWFLGVFPLYLSLISVLRVIPIITISVSADEIAVRKNWLLWRRWREMARHSIREITVQDSGMDKKRKKEMILLQSQGGNTIFGKGLSKEELEWMCDVIKHVLRRTG